MRRIAVLFLLFAFVGCQKDPRSERQSFTSDQIKATTITEHHEVARLMDKYGISRIEKGEGAGEGDVSSPIQLVGDHGKVLANVNVSYFENGDSTTHFVGFGKDFSVTLAQGKIEYVDNISNTKGSPQPDFEHKKVILDDGAKKAIDGIGEDFIALSAGVVSIVETDTKDKKPATPETAAVSKSSMVICNGRVVSASSAARARQWCCSQALEENTAQCSNQYCWGCCAHLGCDAFCWAGDFYCYCYAESRSCSYYPY